MEERTCGICYEICNSNNIIWLICAHIFCVNCINRSLRIKNECPICRTANDEESMLEYIKDLSLKEYENKNINYYNNEFLTFGKYKGKTFIWVYENNIGYCSWCIDNFKESTNINTQFEMFVNYIKQKRKEE
jgi:hypothetical protein